MEGKIWVRPYWHVDAKWFFGILFTFCLFVSLATFSLARLTSAKTAIPLVTYIVASQFSRNGLDDPKDVEEFRRKSLQSGQNVFYPLPDQTVIVTKQELDTLSPRELRLRIFEQVVGPIYKEPRTEKSLKELGVLAFLNYETHNLIRQIFLVSLMPLFLTGLGLVAFSYRYGRFISLAVPLVLLGFGPSLVLFILQNIILPQDGSGLLAAIPRDIILEAISSFSLAFYTVFAVGIVLFAIAFVVKIVSRNRF